MRLELVKFWSHGWSKVVRGVLFHRRGVSHCRPFKRKWEGLLRTIDLTKVLEKLLLTIAPWPRMESPRCGFKWFSIICSFLCPFEKSRCSDHGMCLVVESMALTNMYASANKVWRQGLRKPSMSGAPLPCSYPNGYCQEQLWRYSTLEGAASASRLCWKGNMTKEELLRYKGTSKRNKGNTWKCQYGCVEGGMGRQHTTRHGNAFARLMDGRCMR